MAVVIAAVECQSYGAPSYSAPDYKPTYKSDYKPSYSKGRVNIQVIYVSKMIFLNLAVLL